MAVVGIIGGSGLDNPDILKDSKDRICENKWGSPSSPVKSGTIAGQKVHIIGRHGREHTIPPTFVNNRANIQALKDLGCDCILATTAVGSLREEINRGHLVIMDQFIDFTRHRPITFHESFAPGAPVHTPMAEPFAADLRKTLIQSCLKNNITKHDSGTVITIEGPRFSTRAESMMFRSWGADIINMSTAPEVILANEAGIPYAAVAMSTDYDCWKTDEAPVTWEDILTIFNKNAENVTSVLIEAIAKIGNKN
ncbi:S-methyl-5'-thioadenosine phosphorylase [Maridesulfovibrio bastinii]|uniref:S-methyl-5'-thioadenosine phosphorylase n=1 Tax=Maridesulfovibrio bastinii TaxID=47157 RepID=UPI0003F4DDBE|nr:S-methyl-5'-thioadenosine phosphorylase [Maridesulfovibrio bastinii]